MSDFFIKFTPNFTTIKNVSNETVVKFPVSLPGATGADGADGADFQDWLDGLSEYDSDESAQSGGVISMGWYITADNHVSAPGGMLKQNRL